VPPAGTDATLKRTSVAETAHLVGPGCVKLRGDVPQWRPVEGAEVSLHPRYLRRVICYGNVDFSTAVLRLFWEQGIVVAFLSSDARSLLGKLQPVGVSKSNAYRQHLASVYPVFALNLARRIVQDKIQVTVDQVRYFQQQCQGSQASECLRQLKSLLDKVQRVSRVESLLGYEGQAAGLWFKFFASLLPAGWAFPGRRSRPATDPVNSLLSLGYTLATTRCAVLLAAYDLDPDVGFLHTIRAGRPSLACDLVEYLRAPLVDRMVLSVLGRRQLTEASFLPMEDGSWRLDAAAFKLFLGEFERRFYGDGSTSSWQQQVQTRIGTWADLFRDYNEEQ